MPFSAKEVKPRQRTLSAASITSRFKWSSSKDTNEVIPPVPRLPQPSLSRRESEGLGMWDNNDSAFLKELAMEQTSKKSKRLSVLSFKSSNNAETKVKQRPKSVLLSPKKADTFGIATSPKLSSDHARPMATPRTSTYTKRSSIATVASPSSNLLTFPSPQLRQIDLSLHLPGNEVNAFSDKTKAAEHAPPLLVNGQEGWKRERIVAREPIARPPKSPRRVTSIYNSKEERARQPSLPKTLHLEALPAQRRDESPNVDQRSRVVSIPNSDVSPARSSGIVHGLKKKFGRSAHVIKAMEDGSNNSLGIDFSDAAFRRGSAGLTPAVEKVVNVNPISIASVAPSSFAQYNFPSARPIPIRRTSSSSRGLLKKVVSQDGLKAGSILKHPSIDSLSSRFLTRASHSRESSQHSFIEHTSFDEARSGSFTPTSMASSYLIEKQQKMNKLIREEEAREELRGQTIYTTTRRELSPQRASQLNSPIRPSRLGEDHYTGDGSSDRGHHIESQFNAAHDKKWIAASNTYPSYWNGGRRGSDGIAEVCKGGENHSLHKMHSVDGLTMPSASFVPPLPAARGSISNQVTHRRSDRSLNLSKKQSLKSLHISRPTTVMADSTSADLIEAVSAPAEAHEVLSSDMLASSNSSIRRIRGQERRRQAPSPLQPNNIQSPPRSPRSPRSPRLMKQNSPRHTRSAGGWIEQGPPTFGSSTRSPTTSHFARMQQEHISQAVKRPMFSIELQADAAAAFDCIPSPDASTRIRTKSSPSLYGLNNSHDSVEISGSIKSELSSPSIGEAFTPLSAKLELDPEIVFNGTAYRTDSISHSTETRSKKSPSNVQSLLLRSPPRPVHADAPESPTEEVEVLEDEGSLSQQHHHHHQNHHTIAIEEDEEEEDDSSHYSVTPTSLERQIFGDAVLQSVHIPTSTQSPSLSKSRSFDQLKHFGNILNTTTNTLLAPETSPIDSNEYYVQSYTTGRRASYTYV